MKKILVFGMTENPGGIESVIINYYKHIDRNKVQFDFLCNTIQVAYEEEILDLGGKIYRITARSKNRKKYKNELTNFFEEHAKDYSAIWVNVCSLANIDYLKYAKKYGINCRIIHSHNSQNMDSFLRGLLHRWNKIFINKYATDFWACSDEASKWFFNEKIRKNIKYKLINNAIDVKKYIYNEKTRNEYRKKLNLENNFVIGNIGRLHFQKNHMFMLEIFKKIADIQDNAILILIGQGEEKENIENKIQDLELQGKVKMLGIRDDIPELLQAMDIFLFPSVFEGLPLALLEAQASGINIYTSKEGVSKNAKITDNVEYISLNDSSKKWADKILNTRLANREEEKLKIIEQMSKSGYDIETEAKKMQDFFEEK